VAETGRAVIAFVGTGPSRDPVEAGLGEVDTIAVAPSAWRSGVGRSLIEAALADLVAGGYRHAILWTLADYHPGSAFYSATGWHASGETRDSGRQIAFRHGLSTEPC
jgi:N-acetylglutamate synthase-like GNAT family acetyltransferase